MSSGLLLAIGAPAWAEGRVPSQPLSEQLAILDRPRPEVSVPAPQRPAAPGTDSRRRTPQQMDLALAIVTVGRAYEVEPRLLAAVVLTESGGDALAQSRVGARGLGQIMPATGAAYGVTGSALFDPAINLCIAAAELHRLQSLYPGRPSLALAAYNAGEGAVRRYGGLPPFRETRAYVARVELRLAIAAPGGRRAGYDHAQ